MKRFLLFTTCVTMACSVVLPKAPSGLTPEALRAFYSTYVVRDLDHIRDFAVEANALQPPLLSTRATRCVVDLHTIAVNALRESPAGWKPAVGASLDGLKNVSCMSSAEYARLAPYVVAARAIIQEVP